MDEIDDLLIEGDTYKRLLFAILRNALQCWRLMYAGPGRRGNLEELSKVIF